MTKFVIGKRHTRQVVITHTHTHTHTKYGIWHNRVVIMYR